MSEQKLSHRMRQVAKEYGGTGLLWKDDLEWWASEVAALEAKLEAMERALASNIRSRCIAMIGQGYCTPEEQAPFFPHVPAPVLASVFAEPFVAALAAAQEKE